MTTWYIDPVSGTDSNASAGNGDSFATRRKTISNMAAAAIAPGDTCRIMCSPDATSLGISGAWTEGPYSATAAISSSTNASPIVLTLNSAQYDTMAPAVGDTVLVVSHTTNTNAVGTWEVGAIDNTAKTISLINGDGTNSTGNGVGGASGTVRKINSLRVKLASAVTKAIACTGNKGTKTNWTASANVTCSVSTTDFKEGAESQSIAIAAGFTTGLAAYWPLPGGATDFSAYEQITFWIKQTAGTLGAAGACTVNLCSDAAGATPVDTFNIPALGALNRWLPITVNKGSALGASIQSISFSVVTDNGAQTFLVDNFLAVKALASADSLSNTSLIGKAATGGEFFVIQSINGTRVMLDQETSYLPTTLARGYWGTTESVTTYKRETHKLSPAASAGAIVQRIMDSGTLGSLIAFSGGWNSTDMSTQTGESWFDGQNGHGYGLYLDQTYCSIEKLAFVRYKYGLGNNGSNVGSIINLIACNNNTTYGLNLGGYLADIIIATASNNGDNINGGLSTRIIAGNLNGAWNRGVVPSSECALKADNIKGSASYNVNFSGIANCVFTIGVISKSDTYGVYFDTCHGNSLRSCICSDHPSGDIRTGGSDTFHENFLADCTLNSTIKLAAPSPQNIRTGGLRSIRQDGDVNKHVTTLTNGVIASEQTVRHTASGIAWKLSPITTTYIGELSPFTMPVAQLLCEASVLKTISLWMRRTNTGLTGRLMCKGGQIAGVASDVSSLVTAAADTWEEVSISFTPTEAGVVEILAECWGGTTYSLYVDDLTVS